MLSSIAFFLVYLLVLGTTFCFSWIDPKEIGKRFFLVHILFHAVFLLLTLVFFRPAHDGVISAWHYMLPLVTMLIVSIALKLWSVMFAVISFSWLWGLWLAYQTFWPNFLFLDGLVVRYPHLNVSMLIFWQMLLISLVLGASNGAMWLGHYYLNVPTLRIEELRKLVLGLKIILATRLISAILCNLQFGQKSLFPGFTFQQEIFLTMRLAWGLLLPLVLTYFVWKTVKIQSTQSATGLLYVLVLNTLVGECLAIYLLFHDGLLV